MEIESSVPTPSLPQPKYNLATLIDECFSNQTAADWLTSKQPCPPLSLSEETLQSGFGIQSFVINDPNETSVIVLKKLGVLSEEIPGDRYQTLESVTYIRHACTEEYCLTTATDDRHFFAFMEPPGVKRPGVRRNVTIPIKKSGMPNSHAVICYGWCTDGTSNMTILCYSLEPVLYSEKYLLTFRRYPECRYPKISDVAESLIAIEEPICQFCTFRGNNTCECAPSILQRAQYPSLPPVSQRTPAALQRWDWLQYEFGIRKYHTIVTSYIHGVSIRGMIGHEVRQFPAHHPLDFKRHYLREIIPHITRQTIHYKPPRLLIQHHETRARRTTETKHGAGPSTRNAIHVMQTNQRRRGLSKTPNITDEQEYQEYLKRVERMFFPVNDQVSCEYCPNRCFTRRHDLKMHILTVHLHQRKFECNICGYKFKRKHHLSDHIRNIHGN
jgi:hypothetical protein